MIAVVLQGGLGNQMFQYAAGRSLALARGVDLVLSTSAFLSKQRAPTTREYELGGYHILATIFDAAHEREVALACRLRGFSRLLTPWGVRTEHGARYDPSLLEAVDGTVLRGYWQSERYFKHCKEAIARELTPIEPLPAVHDTWRRKMMSGPSVSVHIRRGDYVAAASTASFHGALPLTYYQSAIERILEVESAPIFFVFSDDPAWCKSNLTFDGYEVHHVSEALASSGLQDMALMRSCRHHIIANSSFSWWSAWLAGVDRRDDGVVIAPRQWFAATAKRVGTSDRFPFHWELM